MRVPWTEEQQLERVMKRKPSWSEEEFGRLRGLADALILTRTRAGKSQWNASDDSEVEMHSTYVGRVEQLKILPTFARVSAIAISLGVEPHELIKLAELQYQRYYKK